MKFVIRWLKRRTAFQWLVLGYGLITLTGAYLLSVPLSSQHGTRQPFIDALFLATSGISTTGLTVVDVGSYYSRFGQIVLLCIFQIGGVGFMAFITAIAYLLRMRMSFLTETIAKESLSGPDYRTLGRFFAMVLLFTAVFEIAAALVLTAVWWREYPLGEAAYLGLFHSVSAFCTAGFSTFSDSMIRYCDNLPVNGIINLVSVAGAIGFIVLYDFCAYMDKRRKNVFPRRLSLQTKLVFLMTTMLLVGGTILIYFGNSWTADVGRKERILESVFQSISASTTDGFNTLDIGEMNPLCLTVLIGLMFVGASPGSTGGGMKTTTFGVLLVFLWLHLRGQEDNIRVFHRTIPRHCVHKAFSILLWFGLILFVDLLVLTAVESSSFLAILFEIVSALANTGLSMGITSSLTPLSKVILILTMFIGRVGPLAAGLFLIGRSGSAKFQYASEDLFIG
ncbi:MAG: hypothetical protein GX455_13195 [Phycisphaerae bacterium]|nr:hypothetical protein [Phycisphaerae bacterium]